MAHRLPLVPTASMLVVRKAMVEGVKGENRFWRYVMFAIIARRVLRRLMDSDPRTVAVERLLPGQTLILRAVTSSRSAEEVKVLLRNPRREVDLTGARTVRALLTELGLDREAHLVIRNGTLVPGDERLDDLDVVEVRPVISGG